MALDQRGSTSFPVGGLARDFNFTVTAANDTLKIWLEDTVTKEQWHTNELCLSDIVTDQTTIPQAKIAYYAQLIVDSLAPKNNVETTIRSLSRASDDGSRVLIVGFTLHTLDYSTALEYSFTLLAVALDPTALLQARFRDVELMMMAMKMETETLRSKLGALEVLPNVVNDLTDTIEAVKADNDQVQDAIAQLADRNTAAKAENDQLRPFVKELQGTIAAVKADNEQLRHAVYELTGQITAVKSELESVLAASLEIANDRLEALEGPPTSPSNTMTIQTAALLKQFSLEEVAKHTTVEDCWMIIRDEGVRKVYDMTKFLHDHPGGPEIMLDLAGQDATDEFEDIGHSNDAREQLKDWLIGQIEGDV